MTFHLSGIPNFRGCVLAIINVATRSRTWTGRSDPKYPVMEFLISNCKMALSVVRFTHCCCTCMMCYSTSAAYGIVEISSKQVFWGRYLGAFPCSRKGGHGLTLSFRNRLYVGPWNTAERGRLCIMEVTRLFVGGCTFKLRLRVLPD